MKLKKLEINGFKSFDQKTSVEFPLGVSAVVGPNGCGKSNVFDAMKWVLGEQSFKELRGSSMGDVIFNGTQKKASLGFAEVSLTFDNQSRRLDTAYDEVTIISRSLLVSAGIERTEDCADTLALEATNPLDVGNYV